VSPYAEERGGRVLNAAINRFAYVTLAPNGTDQIRMRSLDLGEEVAFRSDAPVPDADYQMSLAKGVVRRMTDGRRLPGFDLFTHADCPPGSGLGASSTMVVALVGAFDAWLGLGFSRYETADLAYEIERNDLGIAGGRQDQYAAAFGGFNYLEFGPGPALVTPLKLPTEWVSELEYSIVLAYTGTSRRSSEIIRAQILNFEEGRADAVAAMDRTREMAESMRRTLLAGDIPSMGALLDEAWRAKQQMSDSISNPALDALYAAALEAGALGGKISGAGGGGFMFFFTAFDRRRAVEEALRKSGASVVHFGFRDGGIETWTR
jgi:D-glycero-alpha-D-manno-heptose-7-phosphate kinase